MTLLENVAFIRKLNVNTSTNKFYAGAYASYILFLKSRMRT